MKAIKFYSALSVSFFGTKTFYIYISNLIIFIIYLVVLVLYFCLYVVSRELFTYTEKSKCRLRAANIYSALIVVSFAVGIL